MAETKFIANQADLGEAIKRVEVNCEVLFIQSASGTRVTEVVPVELWKCPELFLPDNLFFIVKSKEDILVVPRVLMDGRTTNSLQPKSEALHVVFQTGGEWNGEGGPRWVMGSIRSLCRNDLEKALYRRVKTAFLKCFLVESRNFMKRLATGPTTPDTVKDIPLATW